MFLRGIALWMCLLASVAWPGCNRGETTNDEEAAPSRATLEKSYEKLLSELGARRDTASALRKRFDALPQELDLPGMAKVQAKLFAAEEVLGVTHARVTWLGGRLEAALKEQHGEELRALSKELAQSKNDVHRFDRVSAELTHELGSLERMDALLKEGAEEYTHVLSTGYAIKGGKYGIERQLIEFLEDPKTKPSDNTWFVFDRTLFGKSGTVLDLRLSKRQVENVVEILRAYPRVKIKIGGFTDNTGSVDEAKQLSSVRAELIKNELVTLGIAAPRILAEGYGEAHPICSANDTEECRAKNRRIAVNVIAK